MGKKRISIDKQIAHAERHVQELEALYKISRILTEGARQKQALSEALDVLHCDLGMSRGVIVLLSSDGGHISVEIAHDISDRRKRSARFKIGEGITGRVVQTGKPMVVPKVSQEPLFLDRLGRKQLGKDEISFLCVPITSGKKVFGALSVDRIFDESASLEEDMRVLSIVASLIAHDVKSRHAEATRRQALEDENIRLRHELEDRFRPENIIGNSHATPVRAKNS